MVQGGECHLALTCLKDKNKHAEQLLARTELMLILGMIIKAHQCASLSQPEKLQKNNNKQTNKKIGSISFHCQCMVLVFRINCSLLACQKHDTVTVMTTICIIISSIKSLKQLLQRVKPTSKLVAEASFRTLWKQ